MKTEFQTEKDKGTEGVTQTADLTIEFMQLDLTSLNSTKTFIEQFKASGRKLNVLVCNAGIVYVPLGNFNFCTCIELFTRIVLRHITITCFTVFSFNLYRMLTDIQILKQNWSYLHFPEVK